MTTQELIRHEAVAAGLDPETTLHKIAPRVVTGERPNGEREPMYLAPGGGVETLRDAVQALAGKAAPAPDAPPLGTSAYLAWRKTLKSRRPR